MVEYVGIALQKKKGLSCPWCGIVIFDAPKCTKVSGLSSLGWKMSENMALFNFTIDGQSCPDCNAPMIHLNFSYINPTDDRPGPFPVPMSHPSRRKLIFPSPKIYTAPEVPAEIVKDFREASLVLEDSFDASAALSRRCLQNVIRSHYQVKKSRLVDEIRSIKPLISAALYDNLDTIRDIGNFAAHPEKDTQTGMIIEATKDEAEFSLEILPLFFEEAYVRTAVHERIRDQVQNKKAAKAR